MFEKSNTHPQTDLQRINWMSFAYKSIWLKLSFIFWIMTMYKDNNKVLNLQSVVRSSSTINSQEEFCMSAMQKRIDKDQN